MSTTALYPVIRWAQRKDKIFITLDLRDIEQEKVQLNAETLKFECTANKNKYQFSVQFCEQVISQESKWSKTGFYMIFIIAKKDKQKAYWPRLRKESKKTNYVQIDWDKWVDEEQEAEQGGKGLGGIDYQNMKNFNDSDDQEQQKKQQKLEDRERKEETINE